MSRGRSEVSWDEIRNLLLMSFQTSNKGKLGVSENSNVRAPLTKLTLASFGAPLSLMKSTYWVTGRLHPKHLLQSRIQVRIDLLQVQIGPDAASNLSAVNLTEQTMTAASHIHMEKRERDFSGVLQETKACSSASDKSISLGSPDVSLSKIRTIPWLQSNRGGFTTSHIIPLSSHSDAVVQVWTAVLSFPASYIINHQTI